MLMPFSLYQLPSSSYNKPMELIKDFMFGEFSCKVGFFGRKELFPEETALFVADTNTAALVPGISHCTRLILEPGERQKVWAGAEGILNLAMEKGLARDSLFCAAGGGVVCDITAFAASLYMRGCSLVLVPTSLLAMVDAALGGKTGINAGKYKNMIGTFYPARELRICPEILKTLPEGEYWNGMAEVIKTAIIGDENLMDMLRCEQKAIRSRDSELLKEIIKRCILVKGALVEEDLREKDRRALLNLGHSFGHALESSSGFSWSHGAAVAWGMGKALEASAKMGLCSREWAADVRIMLQDYGYNLKAGQSPEDLLKAMEMDKKKKDGTLRYILPAGPQDIRMEYLEPDFVLRILKS